VPSVVSVWLVALEATATTVRGALVTEFAYHGVTTAIADSPEEWPQGFRPEHVETIAPPGSGREVGMAGAVERLDERGFGLAATYLDCGFTSDGIWTPSAHKVQAIADATHAAGGLLVADEVQAGHGRTGRAPVVVRAVRPRAGRRQAWEADGKRLSNRSGIRMRMNGVGLFRQARCFQT
jgi:hypothetical protein